MDFGYTNPFVWAAWAQDPDGRLYRYREIYRTKTLVEDHARKILEVTKDEPKPRAILCDHDAEDRATLERHLKMRTTAAYKAVSPGIQAVEARLRKAGDGRPRIFYLRDSLVQVDPALAEAHRPTCTEEEFESYVWDQSNGRNRGEEPVKEHDHGCDMTRYLVAHVDSIGKNKPKLIPMISIEQKSPWRMDSNVGFDYSRGGVEMRGEDGDTGTILTPAFGCARDLSHVRFQALACSRSERTVHPWFCRGVPVSRLRTYPLGQGRLERNVTKLHKTASRCAGSSS